MPYTYHTHMQRIPRRRSENPATLQEACSGLLRRATRVGAVTMAIIPGKPYFHFELDSAEIRLSQFFPEIPVRRLTETHTVGLAVAPQSSRYFEEGWRAGITFSPAQRLRSSFGFSLAMQGDGLKLYETRGEAREASDTIAFGNPFPTLGPEHFPTESSLDNVGIHYLSSLVTNEAYRTMTQRQRQEIPMRAGV